MTTISVAPTVEASNVPPRVRLDVTDTGSPELFEATVTRLDPDGVWRTVRTPDGGPLTLVTSGSDRVGTVYDYEAPFGAPVSYSTVESSATVSIEVTVDVDEVWLIHPSVPAISMPFTAARLGDRSRRVERGVFYPMGRKYPVVQTDGQRKAAEWNLSVLTTTSVEAASLEALLDDTGVLLLNVPADKGWGIGAEYVAVGEVTEGRPSRIAKQPDRIWELALTVVDAPVGGTQADRTYADLLDYASYTDLAAAYDTYADVLAGP